MWVLYFVIGFSTTVTFNNNYQNMQYIFVGHKVECVIPAFRVTIYSHEKVKYDLNGC